MEISNFETITINTVNSFMKVAETQNLTLAASELFITQPMLSHTLKKVEEQLSIKLYTRRAQGIVLTEEGKQFYTYCREYKAHYEEFISSVNTLKNSRVGQVTVTFSKSSEHFLIKYNSAFVKRNPNVSVNAIKTLGGAAFSMLASGEIDICYAHEPDIAYAPKKLQTMTIGKNKYKALISSSDTLAKEDVIHLSDLANHTFIIPNRSNAPGRVELLFEKCKACGFVPRIRNFSSSQSNFNSDILLPNTVYIMPYIPGRELLYGEELVFKDMYDYEEYDNINIVWNPEMTNNLVDLYIECAKENCHQTAE